MRYKSALAAAGAALILASCGEGAETADVEADGAEASASSSEEEASGNVEDLPPMDASNETISECNASLPDGLSVYSGAQTEDFTPFVEDDGTRTATMCSYASTAVPARIIEHYEAELESAGYEAGSPFEYDSGIQLRATRGELEVTIVAQSEEAGYTLIQITRRPAA